MMLLYKAWLESRVRFAIMALALVWACAAVILMQQTVRAHSDEPVTYATFVWEAVYKGVVRDMFVVLVMMLGLGGLVRERAMSTAGFTLALPVSRGRLVATRAAMGFFELTLLAFLPAILLPLLSPLVGESYPLTQSLQFGLLWSGGGAVLFATTFLWSAVLAGEYTAWMLCIVTLTVYLAVIHIPPLGNFPELDFLSMMNGSQMPYFRSVDSKFVGPIPWFALIALALVAAALVWGTDVVTRRHDFS